MTWDLVRAVFLFGLVLLLVWGTTRMVALRMGAPVRGRYMRLLEQIALGRDRTIALVELGGRCYLVGVTPEQVTLLDTVADPDLTAQLRESRQGPERILKELPGSFQTIFQQVKDRFARPAKFGTTEQGLPTEQEEYLRQQIERLRNLRRQ